MDRQPNGRKKVQTSNKIHNDRLSSLPDTLIYNILSLTDTKYAVQICIFSKKWTNHWTHIHSIYFDYEALKRKIEFEKFIRHVLRQCKSFNLCSSRFQSRCWYLSVAKRISNFAKLKNGEVLETDSLELSSHL